LKSQRTADDQTLSKEFHRSCAATISIQQPLHADSDLELHEYTPVLFSGGIEIDSNEDILIDGLGIEGAGLTGLGRALTTTINNLNISTRDGAGTAIGSVDLAISQIDSERSNLGAIQNRFESIISNLQNISENLAAARSRILDADIAKETSEITKQNILQQAGVAILSQANQQPQLALSLLQNVTG